MAQTLMPWCGIHLLLLLLLGLGLPTSIIAQKCYNIDGTSDSSMVPCLNLTSDITATMCCSRPLNEVCLPYGLCSNPLPGLPVLASEVGRSYWRGTCTDSKWQDNACLWFGEDQTRNGARLTPCNDGTWCVRTDDTTGAQCCATGGGKRIADMRRNAVASTSTSTTSSHPGTGTATAVDSTSTGSSNNTSSGPTSGALIGLSVVIALLALGLIATIAFFALRLRRQSREHGHQKEQLLGSGEHGGAGHEKGRPTTQLSDAFTAAGHPPRGGPQSHGFESDSREIHQSPTVQSERGTWGSPGQTVRAPLSSSGGYPTSEIGEQAGTERVVNVGDGAPRHELDSSATGLRVPK